MQHSFGSPSHGNQRRKGNKRNSDWERRSQTVPAYSDMILYIEDCKEATRKLLELIHESCKITGYKIYTQKSLAFLYMNNEKSERKIRNSIHHCNKKEKIPRNKPT